MLRLIITLTLVFAFGSMCLAAPENDLSAENRALRDALAEMNAKLRTLEQDNQQLKAETDKLRQQLRRQQPNSYGFRMPQTPAPRYQLPAPFQTPLAPGGTIPKNWVPRKYGSYDFYVIPIEQKEQ